MIVTVVNPHGTRGPMGCQAARLQPCPSANWRKCRVGLDSFGSSLRLGISQDLLEMEIMGFPWLLGMSWLVVIICFNHLEK
jgi:hypothetical protein